jgi:hypothetical protein
MCVGRMVRKHADDLRRESYCRAACKEELCRHLSGEIMKDPQFQGYFLSLLEHSLDLFC